MRKRIVVLIRIFANTVFFSGIHAYAQKRDCKVMLPAVVGPYPGGCKDGLVHCKCIARGIDHYAGQFSEDVPQRRWTYTRANGKLL